MKNLKTLDDIDLIEKVKKSNKMAFQHLFNGYYQELCNFGLRYTRQPSVTEEIVQEVFIYLWEKRDQIQINSSVKSYLYTAVRNRSINYIKLQLPKDLAKTDVDKAFGEASDEGTSDNIENLELKERIQIAIDSLPTKCRAIFVLSRNGGLTYQEIADELDLSVKTVENQMTIALKKLRKSLDSVWEKS